MLEGINRAISQCFAARPALFVPARHSPNVTIKLFLSIMSSSLFIFFFSSNLKDKWFLSLQSHSFARQGGTLFCFDFQSIIQLDWKCIVPYLLHIVERFAMTPPWCPEPLNGATWLRHRWMAFLLFIYFFFNSRYKCLGCCGSFKWASRQSGRDLFPLALTKCITFLFFHPFLNRAQVMVSRTASAASRAEREEIAGPALLIQY